MTANLWVEALINELDENELGRIKWVIGAFLVAWSAFSGFAGNRLTVASWRKAGAEARLKNGDILERIENSKEELSSQVETFNLLLRNLNEALKSKDKKQIISVREEICRLHAHNFLNQLKRYVEDCKRYEKKQDARDRMMMDVLPGLRTTLRFLGVINHEKTLSYSEAAPYQVDPRPHRVFLRRIRTTLPIFAIQARWQLIDIWWKFRKHYRSK